MLRLRQRMSDSGFSLLEILIAIGLFAIILMSTGWAVVSAVNTSAEAEARDRGIQVAQDAMSIALKTDYDKLGFTQTQTDDAVTAGWYANAAEFELPAIINTPAAGTVEPRVILAPDAPRNSDLLPYVDGITNVDDWTDTTTTGREYTVVTNITAVTEGTDMGGNTVPTGKRITVMVRWLKSASGGQGNCGTANQYQCIYQTFLRNPTAAEQIPAAVGDNTGNPDGCDQPAPFCRVYATEGMVIAKNPGPTGQYPLAQPVNFFIETRYQVPLTSISATINYPEVDRGKVCGDRTNVGGSAIEYGFCGNGAKVPAKTVFIGPATADNPEGFRLLSTDADNPGGGLLFMATIPAETTATMSDPNYLLRGYIRPGTWPVEYTADNITITQDATWGFSDETPLAASLVGNPVVPNGSVRFVVNGLSPNTQPYGESLRQFGSELPGANKSATDNIEVSAQFYDQTTGEPYEKVLYVMKDGIASWDIYATTMSQGYTIPASQVTDEIINPTDFGPQNFIVKVKVTRAVDGITTVTPLKIPISSSSLPQAVVPSAPQNLSVNVRTDVATWDAPAYTGGVAITSYTVRAYDAPSGGNLIGSCTSTQYSCTIPNIVDGNTYYVEIQARNKWKDGEISTPRYQFTSNKGDVPGSPTNLIVTNLGVAQWTAPASNGGRAITSYTVNAYDAITGGTLVGTCTTATLTCTIGGLTLGNTYHAEVVATNVIGDSDPSSPRTTFLFDTRTVPGVPTGLAVNNLGVATWAAPASDGGAAISAYTVSIYANATGGVPVRTCSSATLTCTVTGLTDGTTYYADIYATNAKGDGPTSTPRVQFTYILPNATGGNSIYVITVGSIQYRVHEFTATGGHTFRANMTMPVEYLVVGGGGGGGSPRDRTGGGGGAGGMLTGTSTVTGNVNYTVTVGAGGTGGVDNTRATNGGNSAFGGVIAYGGGRGGQQGAAAGTGGSGGGGHHNDPTGYTLAAGVAGQGNSGGSGYDSRNVGVGFYAGGGGGAGGPGVNTCIGCASPGNGGAGRTSAITGTTKAYAGGGGGGSQVYNVTTTGGSGVGGRGGNNDSVAPTAGAVNTGGGGGGGSARISGGAFNGQNGGSGVVVIRYRIN